MPLPDFAPTVLLQNEPDPDHPGPGATALDVNRIRALIGEAASYSKSLATTVGVTTDPLTGVLVGPNGKQLALAEDIIRGGPDVPGFRTRPVVSVTAAYDFDANDAGSRLEVDFPLADFLTFRDQSVKPIPDHSWFEVANVGTVPAYFGRDAAVSVFPPLPAALAPGDRCVVFCRDGNIFWLDGVTTSVSEPMNLIPPLIAGTAILGQATPGQQLSMYSAGGWKYASVLSRVQWQRKVGAGPWTDITDEVGLAWTPTAADVGNKIRLAVWTKGLHGEPPSPAGSNEFTIVAAAGSAPVNTTPPQLSPTTASVGNVLTATPGVYTNTPTSKEYEFFRGAASIKGPASPATVVGADTYTVQAADVGQVLVVKERALNAIGNSGWIPSSNTVTPTDVAATMAAVLAYDMTAAPAGQTILGGSAPGVASEAMPHGFTGDWAKNPKTKANVFAQAGRQFYQPTLALYMQQGGHIGGATTARIQLADLQGWVKFSDGTWWRAVWTKGISAAAGNAKLFPESWASATPGDGSVPAFSEQAGDGSTYVHLPNSNQPGGGFNYHGWKGFPDVVADSPGKRPQGTIVGVIQCVRARIDPSTNDGNARYVVSCGADWYKTDRSWGGDVALGRFKTVGPQWRLYTSNNQVPTSGGLFVPTNSTSDEWR